MDSSGADVEASAWEMVFTHASFFGRPVEDLHRIAQALVVRRMAYAAFCSDNVMWWREGSTVTTTWWGAKRVGHSHATRSWIPASDDPIVMKAGVDATRHAGADQLLFNDTYRQSTPYLRAYGYKCGLQIDDTTVMFRPVMKLYANGVLLVHLIMEDTPDASFRTLLDDVLNLRGRAAKHLILPPEIVSAAECLSAVAHTRGARARARDLRLAREQFSEAFEANSGAAASDNKRLATAVVPAATDPWPQPPDLYDLYDYYREALTWCLNSGRRPVMAVLRGRKSLKNWPSVFWHERPSLHVLECTASMSDLTAEGHPAQLQLARLLARSWDLDSPIRREQDSSLRPLGDYLHFYNEALTLSVGGVENSGDVEDEAPPAGFLSDTVARRQALVESLQYLQCTLEALGQRSYNVKDGLEGCYALRRDLLHFETLMRSGMATEVNDAMQHASTVFDFPGLSGKIREVLDQVSQLQVDRRNYRLEYVGVGLSVLLLLAATPSITDAFVAPALDWTVGIRVVAGTPASLVVSLLVFAVLTALVVSAWWLSRRSRR